MKRQMDAYQKEAQLRDILRQIHDSKAFERLMNIRLANRELYLQIAQTVVYAYQGGQIKGKMSEEVLVSLVNRMKSGEKPTSITVKRK